MTEADPRTWVEIDLGALIRNARNIRQALHGARLIAVVKKDAYGHGMIRCAQALEAAEAVDELAVYTVEEGLALRQTGARLPILALSPLLSSRLREALEAGITLTVVGARDAKAVNEAAQALNRDVNVALKIDTGLGRLGFECEQAARELRMIRALPRLRISEVFSHFSDCDGDPEYTNLQYKRLRQFLAENSLNGVRVHIAASGVLRRPDYALDAARVGIALYGADPLAPELEPVMSFKSTVVLRKSVQAGASISYGRTFRAGRPMEIAIVSAGYGNGWPRALSNRAEVLIHSRLAPILGVVCMDQFAVDISGVPQCRPGDEVVLFGRDSYGAVVRVTEQAAKAGTISYELCCSAGAANPKNYLQSAEKPV
ncbi:alanine racemase [Candidatus Sumerlaeota bacterium]|nr:alanine racemase [Candidatus Sumerlaeota bacterium]